MDDGFLVPGAVFDTVRSDLLNIISIIILSFGTLSLIFIILIYLILKDYFLSILLKNQPKQISIASFAKNIKLHVEQVSDNYFKTTEQHAEKQEYKQKECIICFDKNSEILMEPCGHSGLCEECMTKIL